MPAGGEEKVNRIYSAAPVFKGVLNFSRNIDNFNFQFFLLWQSVGMVMEFGDWLRVSGLNGAATLADSCQGEHRSGFVQPLDSLPAFRLVQDKWQYEASCWIVLADCSVEEPMESLLPHGFWLHVVCHSSVSMTLPPASGSSSGAGSEWS